MLETILAGIAVLLWMVVAAVGFFLIGTIWPPVVQHTDLFAAILAAMGAVFAGWIGYVGMLKQLRVTEFSATNRIEKAYQLATETLRRMLIVLDRLWEALESDYNDVIQDELNRVRPYLALSKRGVMDELRLLIGELDIEKKVLYDRIEIQLSEVGAIIPEQLSEDAEIRREQIDDLIDLLSKLSIFVEQFEPTLGGVFRGRRKTYVFRRDIADEEPKTDPFGPIIMPNVPELPAMLSQRRKARRHEAGLTVVEYIRRQKRMSIADLSMNSGIPEDDIKSIETKGYITIRQAVAVGEALYRNAARFVE